LETLISIDDFEDERIAEYRNVKDASLERREGLFLVEGLLVVQRFLKQSRFPVRSILILDKKLERLSEEFKAYPGELTVYVASSEVLDRIIGFPFHRGVMALGVRTPMRTLAELANNARRIMVVEGVLNPDNIGSLFRNAAGLGTDAILLDSTCADPLYRMATRVSIGTSLTLPWTRCEAWHQDLRELKSLGFRLLGLSPQAHALDIGQVGDLGDKLAVVLGSEGEGLQEDTIDLCDQLLRIPMQSNVDSLNVATAAAIAMFALSA